MKNNANVITLLYTKCNILGVKKHNESYWVWSSALTPFISQDTSTAQVKIKYNLKKNCSLSQGKAHTPP